MEYASFSFHSLPRPCLLLLCPPKFSVVADVQCHSHDRSMLQSKDTADAMASFGTRRKVEFADMDNPGDENEDAEGKVKARL